MVFNLKDITETGPRAKQGRISIEGLMKARIALGYSDQAKMLSALC